MCDRMNTAWLVFKLDRNSLWQMGLWHLSWVRKHRVAPCSPWLALARAIRHRDPLLAMIG